MFGTFLIGRLTVYLNKCKKNLKMEHQFFIVDDSNFIIK